MNTHEQWNAKELKMRKAIAAFMAGGLTEEQFQQRLATLKKEHLEIGLRDLDRRIANEGKNV